MGTNRLIFFSFSLVYRRSLAKTLFTSSSTHQLLSAALDGRPLLQVLPEVGEWLWILLWCGLGATLAWQVKSPRAILIAVVTASGVLLGVTYLAFFAGMVASRGSSHHRTSYRCCYFTHCHY